MWAGGCTARAMRYERRPNNQRAHPWSNAGCRRSERGTPSVARAGGPTPADVVEAVQSRVLPLRHNRFRTGADLTESLTILDRLWADIADGFGGDDADPRWLTRGREAAAMVAHARWMYRSALRRTESRVLQIRDDAPETDPTQTHRIRTGGLDRIWTDIERLPEIELAEQAS
jgi:succinate dehydrogenase/fumarate reductase flavoprotein subunit